MITFKKGTSPETIGMAFETQGKEGKPFAVSVKMTAVILQRKPSLGFPAGELSESSLMQYGYSS